MEKYKNQQLGTDNSNITYLLPETWVVDPSTCSSPQGGAHHNPNNYRAYQMENSTARRGGRYHMIPPPPREMSDSQNYEVSESPASPRGVNLLDS